MKFRNLIFSFIALTFSSITVFIVVDLMVRFFRPEFVEHFQYDPIYIHKYVPNARKVIRRNKADGGKKIAVTINKYGLRDKDFPIQKNGKRVMVYGDSFIASEMSEFDKTFPKHLRPYTFFLLNDDIELNGYWALFVKKILKKPQP